MSSPNQRLAAPPEAATVPKKDITASLLERAANNIVRGNSMVEPEDELFGSVEDLLESVAANVEAAKPDSDSFLLDQVMPCITDDQLASIVGIHGFVLVNDLAVDPETQTIEGLLRHQEKPIELQLVIRGSYQREHDGEWMCSVGPMDASAEPLLEHQPFDFDPETDAVNLMKALVGLLARLAGPDAAHDPQGPDQKAQDGPASGLPLRGQDGPEPHQKETAPQTDDEVSKDQASKPGPASQR